MIDIQNITLRIGARTLIEGTTLFISDNQRYGIIGKNGCGKSSLFRVLKGELEVQDGSVTLSNGQKMVWVEQELKETHIPILEYVQRLDREVWALKESLSTAPTEQLADIHERLSILNADSAEAKAAEVLIGLGFKQEDLLRPLSDFSGGWRMRVALAGALFQYSDILLMDEPTNHLDLESVLWLQKFLQKYAGTLLLISHDKMILNAVCQNILHFEGGHIKAYKGNYDTFLKTYAIERDLLSKNAQRQQKKREHMMAFVNRFRYKATKAKQAQSRLKMIEKMDEIALLPPPAHEVFSFPKPEPLASPIIKAENVSVGYEEGKPILSRLNFSLTGDDRIALLGANGNGKSTLAKLISGRLAAMDGYLTKSGKLKTAYFAQHQTEELPIDKTAFEHMRLLMPLATETAVRSHLARFGLEKDKALTKIEALSGGEKARLLFAALSKENPHLLILDEPTNHLDIDAKDALIQALQEFSGSVLLITHDFNLIEQVADELWLVKDGKCLPFDGDLNDYEKSLLGESFKPTPKESKEPKEKPLNDYQKAHEFKIKSIPIKKELSFVQKQLDKKTALLEEIKKAFETPLDTHDLIEKQKQYAELEKDIGDLEEKWLLLSEELEALQKR